jgi:hypothetical protein
MQLPFHSLQLAHAAVSTLKQTRFPFRLSILCTQIYTLFMSSGTIHSHWSDLYALFVLNPMYSLTQVRHIASSLPWIIPCSNFAEAMSSIWRVRKKYKNVSRAYKVSSSRTWKAIPHSPSLFFLKKNVDNLSPIVKVSSMINLHLSTPHRLLNRSIWPTNGFPSSHWLKLNTTTKKSPLGERRAYGFLPCSLLQFFTKKQQYSRTLILRLVWFLLLLRLSLNYKFIKVLPRIYLWQLREVK